MSNGLDFFMSADGTFPDAPEPGSYVEGEHLMHSQTLNAILMEAAASFPILTRAWDYANTFIGQTDVRALIAELELMLDKAPPLDSQTRIEMEDAISLCQRARAKQVGVLVSGP
jgi:hypothetical protein